MKEQIIVKNSRDRYLVSVCNNDVSIEYYPTPKRPSRFSEILASSLQKRAQRYLERVNMGNTLVTLMQFFADEGYLLHHATDDLEQDKHT